MSNKLLRGVETLAKPGVSAYLNRFGSRPHPVKTQLILETQRRFPNHVHFQVDPIQGDFLQVLVRALGAKKCLEIGVFTGYSALCIALGLSATGRLEAFDINAEFTSVAKDHWRLAGVEDKIKLNLVPGVQGLSALIREGHAGTFDFAFIDADKENGANYYDLVLQLLRQGGLVAIDNTLYQGSVADPQSTKKGREGVMQQNEVVFRDERVDMCLLPLIDGVTLAVKK